LSPQKTSCSVGKILSGGWLEEDFARGSESGLRSVGHELPVRGEQPGVRFPGRTEEENRNGGHRHRREEVGGKVLGKNICRNLVKVRERGLTSLAISLSHNKQER